MIAKASGWNRFAGVSRPVAAAVLALVVLLMAWGVTSGAGPAHIEVAKPTSMHFDGLTGDHALYARIGESIGRGFLAWAGDQLACAAADRAGLAARLLTEIEGMVLLTSLGLGDAVDAALTVSFGSEPG